VSKQFRDYVDYWPNWKLQKELLVRQIEGLSANELVSENNLDADR